MAKTSGGTRNKGANASFVNRSLSKEEVQNNWKRIGDDIDKNLDYYMQAIERGNLPDWMRRDQNITGIIRQMAKARDVGDSVQADAERIAAAHGGVVTPINYKGFGSTHRKVTNPSEPTALSDLGDSVRNTIVIGKGDIKGVIEDLKKLGSFERYKEQDYSSSSGYTGHLINLRMPNGIKAEIQVNTPRMIFAKETPAVAKSILGTKVWNQIRKETGMEGGLGHKYYEQSRVLSKGPEQEAILRKSREYYSHFK